MGMNLEEKANYSAANVKEKLHKLVVALNDARAQGVIVNFTIGDSPEGKAVVTKMEVLVRVPEAITLPAGQA